MSIITHRVEENQILLLKEKILALDPYAKIYLFGSRCDPSQRGGDIDLLILSDILVKKDLRTVRIAFFERFGEQKLDLLLDKKVPLHPFTKVILPKAILL